MLSFIRHLIRGLFNHPGFAAEGIYNVMIATNSQLTSIDFQLLEAD